MSKGHVLRVGDLVLDAAVFSNLKALMPQTLALFHKQNPLVPGMGKEELREKLTLTVPVFDAVVEVLAHESKIGISGDLVHLSGHGVVMKDEESESKARIEEAFASAGLKVPALAEVLAGLKIDKPRAQKIVTILLRDRTIIKVSEDLVFHRTALEALRRQLAIQKSKSARIDVGLFKEMTGVSRKYAIPLLEYLDRERVTKRVGDTREIL